MIHTVKLKIQNPVISKQDLDKIKSFDHPNFKISSIPILYSIEKGHNGLEDALENLLKIASTKVDQESILLYCQIEIFQ